MYISVIAVVTSSWLWRWWPLVCCTASCVLSVARLLRAQASIHQSSSGLFRVHDSHLDGSWRMSVLEALLCPQPHFTLISRWQTSPQRISLWIHARVVFVCVSLKNTDIYWNCIHVRTHHVQYPREIIHACSYMSPGESQRNSGHKDRVFVNFSLL